MGMMQSVLKLLYPSQCVMCDARLEDDFALCGRCWRDTPFISGLVCDLCGTPLPGTDPGHPVHCDDCMVLARPWAQGRAAMLYRDTARRLVLALKHGDRVDLARPGAAWLRAAAGPMLAPGTALVPVPVHWTRLVSRRYNQAGLLARELAALTGLDWLPDALVRTRRTQMLDGLSRDQRFAALSTRDPAASDARPPAERPSRRADRRRDDLGRDAGGRGRGGDCGRCKPGLRAGHGTRCEG